MWAQIKKGTAKWCHNTRCKLMFPKKEILYLLPKEAPHPSLQMRVTFIMVNCFQILPLLKQSRATPPSTKLQVKDHTQAASHSISWVVSLDGISEFSCVNTTRPTWPARTNALLREIPRQFQSINKAKMPLKGHTLQSPAVLWMCHKPLEASSAVHNAAGLTQIAAMGRSCRNFCWYFPAVR